MNDRTLTSMFRVFAHSGQIQGYRLSGKQAVRISDRIVVALASGLIGLYAGWLLAMRAKPIKCYLGNYDGQRVGLIFATSKREAAKVAGCSVYHFERHWYQHSPWPLPNPKVLTLYTRKNDYHIDWQEGICPL